MTTSDLTARVDVLRKLYAEADFSTPLYEHLAEVVGKPRLTLSHGTVFQIDRVTVDVDSVQEFDTRRKTIGIAKITVYGEMTFRDRTDKSAHVTLQRSANGPISAWTSAQAWNGNAWAPLPDGARKRVTDAVKPLIEQALPTFSHWLLLSKEGWLTKQRWQIERYTHEAERAIEHAIESFSKLDGPS